MKKRVSDIQSLMRAYLLKLPDSHHIPAMRRALRDWIQYKDQSERQKHNKPYCPTQMAISRQANLLARHDPPEAIRMIDVAISHEWRGLWELGRAAKPGVQSPTIPRKYSQPKPDAIVVHTRDGVEYEKSGTILQILRRKVQ